MKEHWHDNGTPRSLGSGRYRSIVPPAIQAFEFEHDLNPADWYIRSAANPGYYNEQLELMFPEDNPEARARSAVHQHEKAIEHHEEGDITGAAHCYLNAAGYYLDSDQSERARSVLDTAFTLAPEDFARRDELDQLAVQLGEG